MKKQLLRLCLMAVLILVLSAGISFAGSTSTEDWKINSIEMTHQSLSFTLSGPSSAQAATAYILNEDMEVLLSKSFKITATVQDVTVNYADSKEIKNGEYYIQVKGSDGLYTSAYYGRVRHKFNADINAYPKGVSISVNESAGKMTSCKAVIGFEEYTGEIKDGKATVSYPAQEKNTYVMVTISDEYGCELSETVRVAEPSFRQPSLSFYREYVLDEYGYDDLLSSSERIGMKAGNKTYYSGYGITAGDDELLFTYNSIPSSVKEVTVWIEGKLGYKSEEWTYEINDCEMRNCYESLEPTVKRTTGTVKMVGNKCKASKVTVTFDGKSYSSAVKNDGSFRVTYPAAGEVRAAITFTDSHGCAYTVNETLELISITPKVVVDNSVLAYSGKSQYPTFRVYDDEGNELKLNKDYTYSKNSGDSIYPGYYDLKIVLTGCYYGKTYISYAILPGKPASASAELSKYNSVTFSWDKVISADGYLVYYKKSSATSWTSYGKVTNTSITKKSLTAGTKYNFKVIPYVLDDDDKKLYDKNQYKTASVTTLKKLDKPAVTISGSKAKISWVNIDGESGYQISKSTSKTGTNIVSTLTGTSVKTTTLTVTHGKQYYYKVRAYKTVDGDKVCGPWSDVYGFVLLPGKPASASVKLTAYNAVKFSWGKSTGADGYLVYYKKSTASKWTSLGKVKNGTSLSKTGLSGGTKYQFKVIPYLTDAKGNAAYDSAQYTTATLTTLKKVEKPAVKKSGSKVKVSWTNIDGETGYQISKSTSKTGTNIVSTVSGTAVKTKQLSATKKKRYYYKVRAYKTVDGKKIFAPWSEAVAFTLK